MIRREEWIAYDNITSIFYHYNDHKQYRAVVNHVDPAVHGECQTSLPKSDALFETLCTISRFPLL